MNEPILVILAAGLGSRYGGLKQIEPIGNNGESIIDFSIYDAYEAGFRRLVLIIRREHEELFDRQIIDNVRALMDVSYAYQNVKDLPEGFVCPANRSKPWGTTQALLSARDIIDAPFMVINADDFYGRESFEIMYKFLSEEVNDDTYGFVGYQLSKTLTENGTVTRAVCKCQDGYLEKVTEIPGILEENGKLYSVVEGNKTELEDGIASMNFWGFAPSAIPRLQHRLSCFLEENIDSTSSELVLPTAIDELVNNGEIKVKVMSTSSKWCGINYPQDREKVAKKIREYKEADIYPFDLWN